MRILGLDVSTVATGMVVLEPQTDERGHRKLPMLCTQRPILTPSGTGDTIERGCRQVIALDEVLVNLRPCFAVIEGYAFNRPPRRATKDGGFSGASNHTLVKLVEVGTCIRIALRRREIPYIVCAPATLKKFVTGRGTGLKATMHKGITKRWQYLHKSGDVMDAYALAQLGVAAIRPEVAYPALGVPQVEAARTAVGDVDLPRVLA